MKKIFRKFDSIKKDVKLRDTDRFLIREKLEEHIKNNPLKNNEITVQSPKLITKILQPKYAGALAALLILILGTSTALAAENSLPGDLLYDLKIDVLEETRSKLTFSKKNKLAWEEKRLDRRLQEAEKLIEQELRINEKTIFALTSAVQEQVNVIFEMAGDLEKKEKDNLESDIQKKLSKYNNTLDNLTTKVKDKKRIKINETRKDDQVKVDNEKETLDKENEIKDEEKSENYIEVELPNREIIKINKTEQQGKIYLRLEGIQHSMIENNSQIYSNLKSILRAGIERSDFQSFFPKECWENNCRIKLDEKYEEFF